MFGILNLLDCFLANHVFYNTLKNNSAYLFDKNNNNNNNK